VRTAILVAVSVLASVAILFAATLLTRTYIVQAYRIPAGSMSPTLIVGDHILVNKMHYRAHQIERGDIAVFRFPRDRRVDFVKRIVGLLGERIGVKNRTVYINDLPLAESYAHYDNAKVADDYGPFTIPTGFVFMLGDNRDNSFDSRFWGPVPIADVKGKVSQIYWSADKARGYGVRWERVGKMVK
jgi:signal peptidase I